MGKVQLTFLCAGPATLMTRTNATEERLNLWEVFSSLIFDEIGDPIMNAGDAPEDSAFSMTERKAEVPA